MGLIQDAVSGFAGWIWGVPLLILLIGGGLFFMVYSRFMPFLYFKHAILVLLGKYDEKDKEGQISHYEALSTALAATVGMGNISGVAVAITMGGPGAIFWMWVSAFFGIATKFFTCTLAVMYRGRDSEGEVRGGPMYVITEGLGQKWRPLAVFFCIFALVGALPIFQANQLTAALNTVLGPNIGYDPADSFTFLGAQISYASLTIGAILTVLVSTVIFGGIKKIGKVAARMVPSMVVLYFILVVYILLQNVGEIPGIFAAILDEAFTGSAILGGGVGAVIIVGAKRAAFSNEAGIGTAPMVHGDTKTDEPVREGLVAMLGPAIDTLLVCTLTALVILGTGVYEEFVGAEDTGLLGVTLTLKAFNAAIPGVGGYLLGLCILVFAVSSLLSYSYYGVKCMSFMFGAKRGDLYNYIYIGTIILGAVTSLGFVVNLIDSGFALMAIPTMISAIILAPKAWAASQDYFARLKRGDFKR
ncbi:MULTISPECIES: alanine/glycine:cation symporter family protein [unclassified Roseivirga]|uniref:alanine/glycine:cation symporter family protein n=1 Tax=uncultured Roseivirga sp. TaxID=543088 RepID=UPI00257E057C|nr:MULTISPECIES: alanine/glycine:cation symporter family protein [unclassified Roseivirga]MEC7753351.1 alanine/glycine:cation symporter family protein [Bacteroidota bacterium]